jgi:hypothetical protein
MNTPQDEVLGRALAQARHMGLAVEAKKPRANSDPADAYVRITGTGKPVTYVVEVKTRLTRTTIGAVTAQLRQLAQAAKRPSLLVTEYISPPIAEQLKALELQFVDTAGNAYLKSNGLFFWIIGKKLLTEAPAIQPQRAFTSRAGTQILFALMCNPAMAAAPYREIAAMACVALGAIPSVMAELNHLNYLTGQGKNRRLAGTRRLLDEWAMTYARKLRPKQLLRTFVTPKFDTWKMWNLEGDRSKWGGEPAAHLLTRHLVPGILTVYAEKPPARLMVAEQWVSTRSLEHERRIELRKPFWHEALRYGEPTNVVPAPLIYADLLAEGDARCVETAQLLYENLLAERFPSN